VIETIFLNNYKQFESFTLSELKRLNIISGQNNTGKTSVLEAVSMFHDRRSVDLTKKQFVWRGVNFAELRPAVLWQPLFFNFDLNNSITIATSGDGCDEKATYQHVDDLDVTAVQSAENGNTNISISKVFSSNSNNFESLSITYSYGDGEQGHSSVYSATCPARADIWRYQPQKKNAHCLYGREDHPVAVYFGRYCFNA
jgi:AAA15 family ATPase/GTPase